MPRVGQILAAWGLAAIAKKNGRAGELREMGALIEQRAPHLKPVLESIGRRRSGKPGLSHRDTGLSHVRREGCVAPLAIQRYKVRPPSTRRQPCHFP